jgi:uncharacterized tellurite resistance protein B-like protein
MLKKLKKLVLGADPYTATEVNSEERQQLALAALLVEMARADFDATDAEHASVQQLLARHFELSPAEAENLVERAATAMDEAVSLFDFTRALHEALEPEQKLEVIRLLWTVAHADDRLDKYEDFLVRKVADLLYVSPVDVLRLKHEVSGAD